VAGCPREVGFAALYPTPGGHCLCTTAGGDTEDTSNLGLTSKLRKDLIVPLPVARPG
jgi:hypothetical protein